MKTINVYSNPKETIFECEIEEFKFKCIKLDRYQWVVDCETLNSPLFRNKTMSTMNSVFSVIHTTVSKKYPNQYSKNIMVRTENKCSCSPLDKYNCRCESLH